MGYRVKPFTMAVRDNSTQQFIDVGLLGSDVDADIQELKKAIVTPEMYGAKGDGTADDTSAIQSAINSKAIVYLNKTYLVTSQISLPTGTRIYGDGTILDRVSPAASLDSIEARGTLLANGTSDIHIEGISIEGTGPLTHYTLKIAIFAYNADNVTIKDVTITDYPGLSAIMARSSNNIHVTNCHIEDYTYGGVMFVEATSYSSISHCDVIDGHETVHPNRYPIMICGYQESYDGSTAPQAYMIECSYNYVYDTEPWWEGIDAHGGELLFVHHNYVLNTACGISVFSSANRGFAAKRVWVYGNGVYNTANPIDNPGSHYGNAFGGNNMYVFDNVFHNGGKAYQDAESAGIYLNLGMPIIFRDNRIENSYGTSLLLAGSYNHAKICDNKFGGVTAHNGVAYGIRFYDSMGSVYSVHIERNTFEGVMTAHVKGPGNKTITSQWVDLVGNTYLSGAPSYENLAYISPDIATPAQIATTTHGDNGKYCANASHDGTLASPIGWVMRNSTTHSGTWEAVYPASNIMIGDVITYQFTTNGTIGYQEAIDPVTVPTAPSGWTRIGYICNSGNSSISNPSFVKDGVLSWYNRYNTARPGIIYLYPIYRRS